MKLRFKIISCSKIVSIFESLVIIRIIYWRCLLNCFLYWKLKAPWGIRQNFYPFIHLYKLIYIIMLIKMTGKHLILQICLKVSKYIRELTISNNGKIYSNTPNCLRSIKKKTKKSKKAKKQTPQDSGKKESCHA